MDYKQCKLEKDLDFQTAWIPVRGAHVGFEVEILEEGGEFWTVREVYEPAISKDVLREKQKMNRNSLPSIIGH